MTVQDFKERFEVGQFPFTDTIRALRREDTSTVKGQ